MRCSTLLAVLVWQALPGMGAEAQTTQPAVQAARSITAVDVARRIGVIADDSMLGRDTPSRGLELTAAYVAGQFRRFGLQTSVQRYPITRRRLEPEQSRVVFSIAGREESASFTNAAVFQGGVVPEQPIRSTAILVGGPQTTESVARLEVRDKVVLFVPPAKPDPEALQQVLRVLFLADIKALVILTDTDSAAFAASIPRRHPERTVIGNGRGRPAIVQVQAGAVKNALTAAGVDLTTIRNQSASVARDLPQLQLGLEMKETVTSSLAAPNSVGILEGTDPKLKNEYVVFSAHMDHIGVTRGQRDSINNGADDDASGTVGVIELAEAFSQPGARPKRSLIFLTVSGEEKGLWGSDYFSNNPPVPVKQIVADINIDMIGRNWPDTIVAIGKEHSDLGSDAQPGQRGSPRAAHDGHRRPLAGGALLLPVRPLQLRPEGRAGPVLFQRSARGLPRGDGLAGQDQQREGAQDPEAAVLPGTGSGQRTEPAEVESGELQADCRVRQREQQRRAG